MKNKILEYSFIIILLAVLLAIVVLNSVLFAIIGTIIIIFGCVIMYLFDR